MTCQNTLSCTRQLVRIAAALTGRCADGDVLQSVKVCLLDYLAACLYAVPGPVAEQGEALLSLAGGSGDHYVLADKRGASLYGSATYHALIATAEDLDDSHRYASGLHMSAAVFPAALALGEAERVSASRFIGAVLAGYEVLGRLGRAVDLPLRRHGFHATGALGPFGAAMTASVLYGLHENEAVNALGIAASGCGGVFAFLGEGSSSRHFHGALAAGSGLSAAGLASRGMTGPESVLEGKDGFFQAYAGGEWDAKQLLDARGVPEILSVYHKVWSTCGHAIPAVTALHHLLPDVSHRLDAIRSITVSGYKASAALDSPCPDDPVRARFSLPAICGIVLTFGSAGVREMTRENLRHESVRRLANLTSVKEDAALTALYPERRAGEVRITMKDGTDFTKRVEKPLGMPENPAPSVMLQEKFYQAAEHHFSTARITMILNAVAELEYLENMADFTRLLRAEH